jgi:hypothetical protein
MLSSNSNLNLNTSLDIDDDLLDNLGRRIEIDQALVDAHLERIPGLGTFSAGGFSGCDLDFANISGIFSGTAVFPRPSGAP